MALDQLGVAGYRFGLPAVAVLLIGGGTAIAYRSGSSGGAPIWAAATAIVGAVATGLLVQRAPVSAGVLRTRLDRLQIPFAVAVSERKEGHSWCRPTCPVVTRTYRLPATADSAAMVTVGSALVREGLVLDPEVVASLQRTRSIRLRQDDATIEAELQPRRNGDAPPMLELTFAARRRQ